MAYNVYREEMALSRNEAKMAAFLTTLAVGAAKESMDEIFDTGDMKANAGGAFIGVLIGFEF